MLPIKSKYKIAKRLGAGIFEQTQTQKFALSEARAKRPMRRRASSDFNRQLIEKQRTRFTYGLKEKELANYAKKAYTQENPTQALHEALELRADSVVYRSGFAKTRRAARQIVSHGHVLVNGTRTTSPSRPLKKGDVLQVREGSRTSPLFGHLTSGDEPFRAIPKWLAVDASQMRIEITGEPQYGPAETTLDYTTVFEFYSR